MTPIGVVPAVRRARSRYPDTDREAPRPAPRPRPAPTTRRSPYKPVTASQVASYTKQPDAAFEEADAASAEQAWAALVEETGRGTHAVAALPLETEHKYDSCWFQPPWGSQATRRHS